MLKSIIILPDGTEISSGTNQTNAVRSVKLTEGVNSGDELTLGSACASMVEVSLITPGGGVELAAGDEITLCKESNGARKQIGVYAIEQPTSPTANTMRLIGYDRMTRLDKDLTEWLRGLDGWPYTLPEFAGMVCAACGLELATTDIPNADYEVTQFTEECTGRQLMQWIGEAAGRFCRATADGSIELATYKENDTKITSSGPIYCFADSLSHENYQVQAVDAVQLKLAEGEDGYLWPEGGANNYIISWNPILNRITDSTAKVLQNICAEIPSGYTPCKVSVPASLQIRAGDIVSVADKNGKTIKMLVMQREQVGQRDTLTCTGSVNRQSTTAVNNAKIVGVSAVRSKSIADAAAKAAVNGQTQEDIFNRLTNNGEIQGFYIHDGVLYINAEFAKIINLIAEQLKSVSGDSTMIANGAKLVWTVDGKETMVLYNLNNAALIEMIGYYGDNTVSSSLDHNTLRIGDDYNAGHGGFRIHYNSITKRTELTTTSDYGAETHAIEWKRNSDGTYALVGTD